MLMNPGPIEAARALEQVELSRPRPRVAIDAFAGTWCKTSEKPSWIQRLDVTVEGQELYVRVFGQAPPSPADWGRMPAQRVFAGSVGSGDALAGAFLADFTLDGMQVELQANLNLGLLVVATFIRFSRPAPLADRFTREFFYRAPEDR